jgi:hypothetical protein
VEKQGEATMAFEIGDAVWFRCGASVRQGAVTKVLRDGSLVWGYRVLPDVRTKTDTERGEVRSEYGLFARPAQREKLIAALLDDADMLASWAQRLAEEVDA